MPNLGSIEVEIKLDTADAEARLKKLVEIMETFRRPWWCPPWLYKLLGN